ncbi:carbamate kinase [Paucibacter sp. B2R-40]|uniref:carbamate kinase n=1 Tax=Paucibacter sp. B2R-40 TaxID=2893554 RepID=UPI0021E4F2C5|nr:carbamate kinase [Paucibacter sp. B2R-40]MCV2356472.1 carbamate kinase [Paucibacter sp. B2R-40]
MKIVIAIGGNALLKRGEALSAANQLANIRLAALQLARVAAQHAELVLTHGNGPQVGLLALQASEYAASHCDLPAYPLDVLGAQTEGMIAYLLEQELSNLLPAGRQVSSLLSRVEVAADDPAFAHPTKPIGPVYSQDQLQTIAAAKDWKLAKDGGGWRRVVASPKPLRVLGLPSIRCLLEGGVVVIACGGGGIPVAKQAGRTGLHGIEAVIDKDLCSAMLATELDADCLIIATDVESVFLDWGLPSQRALGEVTPQQLAQHNFADGSMGPKVAAACAFVNATGRRAVIGPLAKIEAMLAGQAGTQIKVAAQAGRQIKASLP